MVFLNPKQLRVRREQASANLAESEGEKSAHRQTKEALDLSEKTVSLLVDTIRLTCKLCRYLHSPILPSLVKPATKCTVK